MNDTDSAPPPLDGPSEPVAPPPPGEGVPDLTHPSAIGVDENGDPVETTVLDPEG